MTLIASCVAIFITPAMGTMVNLALTAIGGEFNIGTHDLGFLATIFFLTSVMFLVPAAKASSLYGKKKIFQAGLVVVLFASLASSLSQDFIFLCITRAFAGAGAAMVSCTSISMLSDVYSPSERGKALGFNTASVYLGASLSPVLGGLLTDVLGWRSIFYIVVPFAILAILLMLRVDFQEHTETSGRFDYLAAVIYGASIALTMLGVTELPELWAILLIVVGLVMLALFVRSQTKAKDPLMDLKLFKNSRFNRSILAVALNYASTYSVSFFMSLYLQSIGQLTATSASLILLIQPIIQTFITPTAGRMSDTLDKRYLPTLGMSIIAVGLVLLLFVGVEPNFSLICIALAIMGLGYSLFSAPNTNAVMSYVRAKHYNDASAMISTMRQTGMLVSMGISMCIITVIMGNADNITPETYGSFVEVIHVAWCISIGCSVVGAIISWFRGKGSDDNV